MCPVHLVPFVLGKHITRVLKQPLCDHHSDYNERQALIRMGLDPGFSYIYPSSMLKNKRDRLVKMGYVKRDAPSAPRLHAKKKVKKILINHDKNADKMKFLSD
jgi:hypothetical protein